MAVRDQYAHGQACWFDMGTTDVDAAIAFYRNVLGWTIEKGPEEMGFYSQAEVDGHPVAAIAAGSDPNLVVWTVYFAADDIDATVAVCREAGATVLVEPFDVMEFGRMAIIVDPTGCRFALWQRGTMVGAELTDAPGAPNWVELTTRAVAESQRFYGEVFGWVFNQVQMGDHNYFQISTANGEAVGGLMPMEGDMWPADVANHWMLYFGVADTDKAAEVVAENGGTVCVPPTTIPPGRFAVVQDGQGATFSILTPRNDAPVSS